MTVNKTGAYCCFPSSLHLLLFLGFCLRSVLVLSLCAHSLVFADCNSAHCLDQLATLFASPQTFSWLLNDNSWCCWASIGRIGYLVGIVPLILDSLRLSLSHSLSIVAFRLAGIDALDRFSRFFDSIISLFNH